MRMAKLIILLGKVNFSTATERKRNMKTILLVGLVAMLAACTPKKSEKRFDAKSEDNVQPTDRLDKWLKYYGLTQEAFVDSSPMTEEKLYSVDYDYLSDTNDLYRDFFIFSPDSAHFIDLDSYSLALERDSLGQLVSDGSEVDTETALIDIKGKRRIRVLFCGTACWPEEIQWINDDFVYILGFSEGIDGEAVVNYPTIWMYEISNSFFQEIRAEKTIDTSKRDYVKDVRLKKVMFDY